MQRPGRWTPGPFASSASRVPPVASHHAQHHAGCVSPNWLLLNVASWPTSTDLRIAQRGQLASWGTSDVPLVLSAQPFVTRSCRRYLRDQGWAQ
jgi:hypothetical protein